MVHFLLKNSIIFLTIFLTLQLPIQTKARPGLSDEYTEQFSEDRCRTNDQRVVEVCQRCAKQTKSPIVYPMCCENEDDAFNWCEKYINYGNKP